MVSRLCLASGQLIIGFVVEGICMFTFLSCICRKSDSAMHHVGKAILQQGASVQSHATT